MRFLGLDSSTQSLTALLVDTDTGEVIDRSVAFGARLPQYKSPNGFLAHADPRVKHSDPLMWVEALDLLLGELREAGVDLSTIRGVSGAGPAARLGVPRAFDRRGRALVDRATPLVDQVRPLLSRKTAPIWMDASTGAECAEITKAAGGPDRMVAITGSIAIERFTGPQIRKYWKDDPAGYEAHRRDPPGVVVRRVAADRNQRPDRSRRRRGHEPARARRPAPGARSCSTRPRRAWAGS